jgi:8-oxo-dGTP pyrophosphatase MutT (NUDIX family)
MAYEDKFRLSSHAVITNSDNEVLLLKASYADESWGLPGGALEPGETIHEALLRECLEELSCNITVQYLSGVYYHRAFDSQAFIFRCQINPNSQIRLSNEHIDYKYAPLDTMSVMQRLRVEQCLAFNGKVTSAKF